MKVLFDQGTPVPLRGLLSDHDIATAYELGWSALSNGEFLDAAEAADFEAIVTTDTNIRHQQNLSGRKLGVVVLPTTNWSQIRAYAQRVIDALDRLRPGTVSDVSFDA